MSRPIILYENLRNIIYAPFYLAERLGAFANEGLDVEIRLSPATTETAAGLLAGRADVSWGGPMRVLLDHDRDPESPLVCFSLVVARDPFYLIGRGERPGFRLAELAGLRVGVATDVPTPGMTFQDDLRRAGIDPASVWRQPDRPMAENAAAFEAGELDVVHLFEPYAERLLASGQGRIWHSFAGRGELAWTSFYTTRRFAAANPAACIGLGRALRRALAWLAGAAPEAAASHLLDRFPEESVAGLARMIARYQRLAIWAAGPAITPAILARLRRALLSGGLITREVAWERAVESGFDAAIAAPPLAPLPPRSLQP